MYTSYSKINDRFGFNTGGTFRCPYLNIRTYLSVWFTVILIVLGLTVVSIIYVMIKAQSAPDSFSIQTQAILESIINGAGFRGDTTAGRDLIDLGFGIVSVGFGIIVLVITIIAFLIFMAVMKTGQTYKFKADEEKFTVIYPQSMNQTLIIEYDLITGLTYEEWRFFCAPKCLEVTIYTKQGNFSFKCIHTPMSKANGITETPFNIIRERIGLAHEDEAILINKEASKEQKPSFLGR